MKKRVDPNKIADECLFDYFIYDCPDNELVGMVQLLPIATGDNRKIMDILRKIVRKKATLVSVYPGMDEEKTNTDNMEYIGDIPDGVLYLKE